MGGDLFAKPNAGNKEEAEAQRALEIVNKKLSQTLSVSATVNELIQQATDVKNLALLFSGVFSASLRQISAIWLTNLLTMMAGWGAYA